MAGSHHESRIFDVRQAGENKPNMQYKATSGSLHLLVRTAMGNNNYLFTLARARNPMPAGLSIESRWVALCMHECVSREALPY